MPSASTRRPMTVSEPPTPGTTAPPWATNLESTKYGGLLILAPNARNFDEPLLLFSRQRRQLFKASRISRNIILKTSLCADSSPLTCLYLATSLLSFWDRSPTPDLKAWNFFVRAVTLITPRAPRSRPWLKLSTRRNLLSTRCTPPIDATSALREKAARGSTSAKW